MTILVQKYGGTSLDTRATRESLVSRVREAVGDGAKLAVVVSAMGRRGAPYATDTLLDLVRGEGGGCTSSELCLAYVCGELLSTALIASALRATGLRVASMPGWQAGFVTDDRAEDATIVDMRAQRVLDALDDNDVVVVAGSQGMSRRGEVTTLGRGGSDTSACALGVALAADRVELYKDTPGIMTADPRLVPGARRVAAMSYRACLALSRRGAKVLHPRAVEHAASHPPLCLWVGQAAGEVSGTTIGHAPPGPAGSAAPPHGLSPEPVGIAVECLGAQSVVSLVGEGTFGADWRRDLVGHLAAQGIRCVAGPLLEGHVVSVGVAVPDSNETARLLHEYAFGMLRR
jgi:aspartate kinase